MKRGRRAGWLAAWALPAIVLAGALAWHLQGRLRAEAVSQVATTAGTAPAESGPAGFVGSAACAGCHEGEAKAWRGSHHARAMQHADAGTVLGDFNQARLAYGGRDTVFLRRGDRHFVRTEGADGKAGEFEVRYVIGLEPLQQYLVALPDGRIQALPFAWDTRAREEGGQRWYSLYPDEAIGPGDPLHWTGPYQNWNWMCADCHTTKLERNYDPQTDRFDTTWAEFDVGCEACHGPGSGHVAWSRGDAAARQADATRGLAVLLDERQGQQWQKDEQSGLPVRLPERTSQRELTACAQCHSRRSPHAEGMDHDGRFLQTHEIARLDGGLYFADGQQREEVYEVGSFMQSRMHAAGVSCSDCHEPHSGQLRAPGDAVCGQCHAPSQYARREHTLHAAGSSGSACVDCHMPERAYMGVDLRRDHFIRAPQPMASAAVGAPDACTSCHADRDAAWAEAAIRAAHGPRTSPVSPVPAIFHAASLGEPGMGDALATTAQDRTLPAITRATALSHLRAYLDRDTVGAVQSALVDPDAMVRAAAVEALHPAPPAVRLSLALPMTTDASRIVRLHAAHVLVGTDLSRVDPAARTAVISAFSEFEQSRRANADRAEARVELGAFLARQGRPADAEKELRAAMAIQPGFAPAYVSLAELLQETGRDAEVEAVLDAGLARQPADAAILHAKGLLRVRQGDLPAALPLLGAASAAAPANARFAYVHAVALHDAGRRDEAIAALEAALLAAPGDRALQQALEDYRRRPAGRAR
jgi:thioredoxin-like negative regulator of GroEL/formate-dependent nitrite reductase cytochrome c552 subunit